MGLSRLATARDNGLEPLLAWLVAALLFASLALWRGLHCSPWTENRDGDPSG